METSIVEIINTAASVQWSVAVPQYFFFTGVSAAAFLISSLTYVFNNKEYEPIAGLALIMAFTVLLAAPLNLIADLAQPGRFYSLYYHLHSTSPMSWGVFLLTFYPILISLEMLFVFRAGFARKAKNSSGFLKAIYTLLALGNTDITSASIKRDHEVGRVLGMIGIPAALAVHGYTGYILGVVKARPLWHTSLMPLIFLISAMVSGIALMILVTAIMVRDERGKIPWNLMDSLGKLLVWSILGDLLLRLLWYSIGYAYSFKIFQEALPYVFKRHFFEAVVLELGFGLLFPLIVSLFAPLRRIRPLFLFASFVAICGVWLFRWDTVIGGQELPKISAGVAHYFPSFWGATGIMHVVSNWAIWMALFLGFTWFMPWEPNEDKVSGGVNSEIPLNTSAVNVKGVK
ncbi:Tetrathionate reductase subunit C [Dissulfuribacter thermophilus]|uniref:Tetrathionate reductase subunit C n=1 Tax=Dissulfuribacter thermophilus TaxID=1156395 RepID=A0A1B9F6D1_9BACT|nr:NrfD/PsrC family molybdoenzyme membrane anchor subunit [Dissulfuribacter thermophilus]OCC15497.1 Tetrathionate reductase subunit C [Dissulfuribacter thermophilus]